MSEPSAQPARPLGIGGPWTGSAVRRSPIVDRISRTAADHGALLVTGLLIVLAAAVVMIVSGALSAFFDFLGGSLAGLEPHLGVFRFSTYLWAVAWISLLLGLVTLSRLLILSGDEQLAVLSLAAAVIATVLGILEATFNVGVTTWAVEETVRTGTTPEIYTVLKEGLSACRLFTAF